MKIFNKFLLLGASLAVLPTVFFIPSKIILNELNKQVPPEPAIIEYAVITNIHDGDTVSIRFTKEYPVRLLNCWTPEITGKEKVEGLKAKEYLQSILKPGDKVILQIPTTEKFQDSISLGRILGRVWKDVDNDGELDNISEIMVASGFAKTKK